MNNTYSLLNNDDIKKYRNEGEIVIEPFNTKQLGNTSYDITLGPNFYIEQKSIKNSIHNMYSKESTDNYWGKPQKALPYSYYKKQGILLENIKDDDLVIPLEPHECILGHSNEFIGGRTCVTNMLKARSSIGRNNITICSCAGWSDIGFFNRYVLELRNLARFHTTFLVIGRRIGQIIFLLCNKVSDETFYSKKGKYQTTDNLEELKKNWNPSMMIPKSYKDYECQ